MTQSLDKIQNLLPIGYLYLIILGIVKESLHYYQLDINILKYSSLMDVLISPVADLTSRPVIFFAVLLLVFLSMLFQFLLSKNSDSAWVQKLVGHKPSDPPRTKDEIKSLISQTFLGFFIAGLSSFFFSQGISDGRDLLRKIESNELTYGHKIIFDSDKSEVVHLFDNNSSYYFYLSKGNKNIKIAPVGSIKNVELLHQD